MKMIVIVSVFELRKPVEMLLQGISPQMTCKPPDSFCFTMQPLCTGPNNSSIAETAQRLLHETAAAMYRAQQCWYSLAEAYEALLSEINTGVLPDS